MKGLAFFIAVVLAASAFGATLVLQPGSEGKDATMAALQPTTNRGSWLYLIVNWSPRQECRAVVEFTGLSAIAKSTINSAELDMYNSSGNNPNEMFGIYRVTASWQEMTVTWSNQPAHFATSYANTRINGIGHYKWDIKNLVQEWVSETYPNYGFMLKCANPAVNPWPYIDSSDHATADWRPKLTVDYTASAVAPTSFGKVKALFE